MKAAPFIAAAMLATSFHASAAIISVNFQGGRGTPLDNGPAVTGTAGVEQVGNWNNATGNWLSGGGPGSLTNLRDSTGTATTVGISYSSSNTYDYQNGDGGSGDKDMMSGFLDNWQTGTGSITITGLTPNNSYDVYVYFNRIAVTYLGATASDGTNTNTYYARHNGAGYSGSYTISQDDNVGDGWTDANVFLFSGYTGSTFTLDDAANPGAPASPGGYKMIVNGIQIVMAVPEPSSTALLGLGGIALMLRRRRK